MSLIFTTNKNISIMHKPTDNCETSNVMREPWKRTNTGKSAISDLKIQFITYKINLLL
jgi:hypothetical protein